VNITPITWIYGRYTELLFMGVVNQLITGEAPAPITLRPHKVLACCPRLPVNQPVDNFMALLCADRDLKAR